MRNDPNFEELYTPSTVSEEQRAWFVGPTVSRRRFTALTLILLSVFIVFFARSFQLEVLQSAYWKGIAERNRTRVISLPAARGEIRDQSGIVLATNSPQFAVMVFPDRLPKDLGQRSHALEDLARRIGVDANALTQRLSPTNGDAPVVVADQISRNDALPLMATLPSQYASVLFRPERQYNDDGGHLLLGNLLGFAGRVGPQEYQQLQTQGYRQDDLIGKQGVEKAYESALRGTDGELVYDVSADGSMQTPVSRESPTAGSNLTLTVNSDLQHRVASAIAQYAPGKNGAVVVLDTESGAVRALVSYPDFSPNIFSGNHNAPAVSALLVDPRRPLYNRAITGLYPSGSSMKPFYATGALSDGTITPRTSILSRGGIRIGGSFFPDWKAGGHGITNVTKALAESVNSFFYLVMGGYPLSDGQYPPMKGVGVARMASIAKQFGFSSTTGVDLPGEQAGFFPSPEWKQSVKNERWYIGDTYHLAIGQGDLLVTPVQLAVATERIANAGTAYRPFVLERITDHNGKTLKQIKPTALPATEFTPSAFSVVADGMRHAVTSGSARRLADLPIAVAGKTGTAQWNTRKATHSWFIGFAPFQHPKIALAVLVEEGGEGSGPALSIAKEIFQWYAQNMKPGT